MDHSLEVARDAKTKLEATERAHVDADKKLKGIYPTCRGGESS